MNQGKIFSMVLFSSTLFIPLTWAKKPPSISPHGETWSFFHNSVFQGTEYGKFFEKPYTCKGEVRVKRLASEESEPCFSWNIVTSKCRGNAESDLLTLSGSPKSSGVFCKTFKGWESKEPLETPGIGQVEISTYSKQYQDWSQSAPQTRGQIVAFEVDYSYRCRDHSCDAHGTTLFYDPALFPVVK